MDANRLLFCESKADKKGLAAVPVMRWKDTAAFWWYAEVVGVIGVSVEVIGVYVGVTGIKKIIIQNDRMADWQNDRVTRKGRE